MKLEPLVEVSSAVAQASVSISSVFALVFAVIALSSPQRRGMRQLYKLFGLLPNPAPWELHLPILLTQVLWQDVDAPRTTRGPRVVALLTLLGAVNFVSVYLLPDTVVLAAVSPTSARVELCVVFGVSAAVATIALWARDDGPTQAWLWDSVVFASDATLNCALRRMGLALLAKRGPLLLQPLLEVPVLVVLLAATISRLLLEYSRLASHYIQVRAAADDNDFRREMLTRRTTNAWAGPGVFAFAAVTAVLGAATSGSLVLYTPWWCFVLEIISVGVIHAYPLRAYTWRPGVFIYQR